MKTTGNLRILSKSLLERLVTDAVQASDIRWLKSANGVFPRKQVWAGEVNNSEFKETPYTGNDTFIVFDVVQGKNIATERIDNVVYSMLPFTLVVNIYGNACEDQVQHIIAKIHNYETRLWLNSQQVTITREPNEYTVLDGRENGAWWFRRRIELDLVAQQEINYNRPENESDDLIRRTSAETEVIGGL